MKSEEYSASWDSDIILVKFSSNLNEIANFKSDPLDQVFDFTGATLSVPSHGRFEILILLSYEVADELGGGMAGGMWYPSERNRAVERNCSR